MASGPRQYHAMNAAPMIVTVRACEINLASVKLIGKYTNINKIHLRPHLETIV